MDNLYVIFGTIASAVIALLLLRWRSPTIPNSVLFGLVAPLLPVGVILLKAANTSPPWAGLEYVGDAVVVGVLGFVLSPIIGWLLRKFA